jgi:tRNA (guanine37-N1)-methyltransferase
MSFHILTLFPEAFTSVLSATMLQKGQERGALQFELIDIRDFAADKHRVTDDAPYGGGQGMVMKPEPVVAALESIAGKPWRILLTPRSHVFKSRRARRCCRASLSCAAAGRPGPALDALLLLIAHGYLLCRGSQYSASIGK